MAITAGDHGSSFPKQRHHRVARRGCLPSVAVEGASPEEDFGDFPLCRTRASPIEGSQSSGQSSPLLACQTGIRRNGPTVERREKALDRLDPVKSLEIERYDRDPPTRGWLVAGA